MINEILDVVVYIETELMCCLNHIHDRPWGCLMIESFPGRL
jgi:hypothetical protein